MIDRTHASQVVLLTASVLDGVAVFLGILCSILVYQKGLMRSIHVRVGTPKSGSIANDCRT